MEISRDIVSKSLELYTSETRVLTRAELVFPESEGVRPTYPVVRGEFKLPPTFYTNSPLKHVADIEIQLCLNQLAYVGISEALRNGGFNGLKGINFENIQTEGCFVIESRKKFRKPIDPARPISGEIRADYFSDRGNVIFAHAKFDFENRSCFGDLTLALIRNPLA